MFLLPRALLAVDLLPRSDGAEYFMPGGPPFPRAHSQNHGVYPAPPFIEWRFCPVGQRFHTLADACPPPHSQNRHPSTLPARYLSVHHPAAGLISAVGSGPSHPTVANRLFCSAFNGFPRLLNFPPARPKVDLRRRSPWIDGSHSSSRFHCTKSLFLR